jgi:predicted membrane-bound mannosyltransferase
MFRRGFIPLTVHAMTDPVIGILLIVAPFIFGFDDDTSRVVSFVTGALVLLVAMTTRWRLSLVKLIPLRVHAMLDLGLGVVLILAPFVLGYSDETAPTVVHVVIGVAEILAALATRWDPDQDPVSGTPRPARNEPLSH